MFLREKGSLMSPFILGDARIFIVLRAWMCGVHVRFESRRQKSNYRLLLLRGTPKANVSFPWEDLKIPYYPTERFILRISIFCKLPFIGSIGCLHQFETVRVRTMIVVHKWSRLILHYFFFLYKRNKDSSDTCVLDQAKNGSSFDTARN